jgi:hypothetical protein
MFVGLPLVENVSEIQDWAILKQFPFALREKYQAAFGETYWPQHSSPKFSGTISAITDNGDGTWTLTNPTAVAIPGGATDDGTWWNGVQRPSATCTIGSFWVGVSCDLGSTGGTPYLNGNYDVVLERFNPADAKWYRTIEPWDVQRYPIVASTNATLTFSGQLANWVTSKFLTSASALNGCRFHIIRRSDTWWHERWMQFPNDRERWRGVADRGKMYADGKGYLVEEKNSVLQDPWDQQNPINNNWPADRYATNEVLVYREGASPRALKRLVSSGNDANTIFFGGLTAIPTEEDEEDLTVDYTIAGTFTIVRAGQRGYPENLGPEMLWWYGGQTKPYYGHDPRDRYAADGLVPTYGRIVATTADSWAELESIEFDFCGSDTSIKYENNMFDSDVWVSKTNTCDSDARADSCRTPDLFKTIRGWQRDTENLVAAYMKAIDYDNANRPTLDPYTRAQIWFDCGINAGTTLLDSEVTTGTDTRQFFTVAAAYFGQTIYYQLEKNGIRYVADGVVSADAAGKVITGTNNPLREGATVVYSAGWSRFKPEEFPHLTPIDGNFIGDVVTPEFAPPSAIDPPAIEDFELSGCFGTGRWVKRAVSTGPLSFAVYGWGAEDSGAFVPDRLYRHVGNNWCDTLLGDATAFDPTVNYDDHAYEELHPKTVQLRLRAERSGRITSGNLNSFTDDTQTWWRDWFNGGTLRTESGYADSGSTISLVTDNTRGDTEREESCWWAGDRFEGFTSAYEGFMLDVIKNETNPTSGEVEQITYKFPILSTEDVGITKKKKINFASQVKKYGTGNVTVTAGDAWKIKEPRYS